MAIMMSLEEQQQQETTLKAEYLKALGTLKGFEGFMVATDTACPHCAAAGHKTNGGYTPLLRRRSNGVLWCHHHGDQ